MMFLYQDSKLQLHTCTSSSIHILIVTIITSIIGDCVYVYFRCSVLLVLT